MNKEFLVILLEKDIRELELLTKGFEDLDIFPKPILQLAKQKAENIIKNLEELENIKSKTDVEVAIPVKDDESVNKTDDGKEAKFVVEEKPAPEVVEAEENIVQEPDIIADEKADYVEDIKAYGIQDKNHEDIKYSDDAELDIEEIFVDGGEPVVENVKDEIDETLNDVKITDNQIVTLNEIEAEDNGITTLNSSIKISDIRAAINIGDRFRFQRELFGGNGEVMNKTISYLNQLAKYDEAASFLDNKFGWAKDNVHAEDFLQIIRRRYL